MKTCKFHLLIPSYHGGPSLDTCGAYSASKRYDGLHWSHYPKCAAENCPLLHPELLTDERGVKADLDDGGEVGLYHG